MVDSSAINLQVQCVFFNGPQEGKGISKCFWKKGLLDMPIRVHQFTVVGLYVAPYIKNINCLK